MRAIRLTLAVFLIVGFGSGGCSVNIEQLYACDTQHACECPDDEIGVALCRADGGFERCICQAGDAVAADADREPDLAVDVDQDESEDLDSGGDMDASPDVDADAADAAPDTEVEDVSTDPGLCTSVVSDPFDNNELHHCWTPLDIGGGAAGDDEETTSLLVTANGADIWFSNDQFRFVYQRACGDISVTLRVNFVPVTHDWAKAGLMLRETVSDDSRFAATFASRDHGYAYQRRVFPRTTPENDEAGAFTNDPINPVPGYVRLTRHGNLFDAAFSADAITWTPLGTGSSIDMARCIFVGVAVTSHADGVLGTASFNDFTVESGGAGE